MNLDKLITDWLKKEKADESINTVYIQGYNQALQDLKSRKQELIEGIEKLIAEENEMNAREEAEYNDLGK